MSQRNKPLRPVRLLLVVSLLVAGYWLTRDERPVPKVEVGRPAPAATAREAEPATKPATPEQPSPHERSIPSPAREAVVSKVTLRDLEGQVVFRGDINVQPTLERIAAGRLLEYRNDGSTFQNREGRLPRKPSGYYKEYVHPTPELAGPGPQRIVVGKGGEMYYTPDHYRSFQRLP